MTNKKSKPLSKCCNALVRAEGMGDFKDKDEVCTMYYVCQSCNNPCDILRDYKDYEEEIAEKNREIEIMNFHVKHARTEGMLIFKKDLEEFLENYKI